VALFLSTYVNKVDKKGRVSVPSSFRVVLSPQEFQGIIAYGSFINDCIEACGLDRIERLSQSIDQLDPYSEERDAFAATILGGSIQLPFDGEGRVMLPPALQQQVGITEHVVFVGKGATFEIWHPEKFELYAGKARQLAKQGRAHLRLSHPTTHKE
jgi:MraZ protein